MSTKSTSPEERLEKPEGRDEKNAPTSESWQNTGANVHQKHQDGKPKDLQPTLDAEVTADLLARLQDILSLWTGSDNKIIGNYVMTAFPIPAGMKIDKVMTADGKKAFTVDGVPVVNMDKS